MGHTIQFRNSGDRVNKKEEVMESVLIIGLLLCAPAAFIAATIVEAVCIRKIKGDHKKKEVTA